MIRTYRRKPIRPAPVEAIRFESEGISKLIVQQLAAWCGGSWVCDEDASTCRETWTIFLNGGAARVVDGDWIVHDPSAKLFLRFTNPDFEKNFEPADTFDGTKESILHEELSSELEALIEKVKSSGRKSRESSLVLTKLQEAEDWLRRDAVSQKAEASTKS